MPKVKDKLTGDVISNQPYTAEGTQRAEQIAESDPNWEMDYAPGGKESAMDRSTTTYAGGGKTGYNVPQYHEGGNVHSGNLPSKQKAQDDRVAEANKAMAKRAKEKASARKSKRSKRKAARKESFQEGQSKRQEARTKRRTSRRAKRAAQKEKNIAASKATRKAKVV